MHYVSSIMAFHTCRDVAQYVKEDISLWQIKLKYAQNMQKCLCKTLNGDVHIPQRSLIVVFLYSSDNLYYITAILCICAFMQSQFKLV